MALIAIAAAAWVHFRLPGSPARASAADGPPVAGDQALAGSEACQRCHAAFFQKWSTSFHGLAMRPYTPAFAREHLLPQAAPVEIQGHRYRAVVGTADDHVEETGPEGTKRYPIAQVLGGKNVAYFLTPQERGFLQTLPVAYDVRRREWFSTPGSAVRHLEGVTSEELPWTDRAYTFNTSCFGCHVSQLSTNYDPGSDSYRTAWAEPGINCETCHGPAGEHVRVFEGRKAGEEPPDPRIVSVKHLSHEQRNDLCASCHAKASPLWTEFRPGDRFSDHFALVTLEDPDYYPDGRDLGENYTFTSWRMSPCARSGRLDCVHCHTSSGRYKWKDDPNGACRSCHEARVREVAKHSHHRSDGPAGACTACHMPMTEFARMRRSDHSMRPPLPAATLAFGSPNACNLCHADKDARWALRAVRSWRGAASKTERRVLREGELVVAARKGDWSRLPAMLAYLSEPGRDEIVSASLARLLQPCPDPSKWPLLRALAADPSPIVRAAAVTALAVEPGSRAALLAATRDESLAVRVRAAEALTGVDVSSLAEPDRRTVSQAISELERSLQARPDQFASHYDLGNFEFERGAPEAAVAHYRKALELRPDHASSLVNLSMAEARLGRLDEAEGSLRKAIAAEPHGAAAPYNLGLLLAERGRPAEAKVELQRAFELDPRLAGAAYNLAVLVAKDDPRRAAELARRAAELEPQQPKYLWARAYYAADTGDLDGARHVLEGLVQGQPGYADGWALLANVLERQGRVADARRLYARAADNSALSASDRAGFR
ncbi:MAG TPA: tetratricopeptide repeat protein, partial [Vicinamibacteria bacterium]|nr:tetratricopeptide repeat protein [Vicinamibacteria bacterium]